MKAVCELRHPRYVIVADEPSSRACGRTTAHISAVHRIDV